MNPLSVTTKGQVTIPVAVRKALGIKPGTKVLISVRNGAGQIKVIKQASHSFLAEGAGMLRVRSKTGSLRDFDPASLLKRGK
jgi:antitoxin PrlF